MTMVVLVAFFGMVSPVPAIVDTVAEKPVGQPGTGSGMPLAAFTAPVAGDTSDTTKETGLSYLQDIEQELVGFEKNHLIRSTGPSADTVSMLDDCMARATERHLPIEIARDKISLYHRKLIKALRDLFPGINVSYEHNRGFKLQKADTLPGNQSNQQFRSRRWNAALFQPVFKGGALWNKVNEERANLRGAQAEYDKVFFDLSVEVVRAYFNYAKARTMLSFKETLLMVAGEKLKLSEEKMKAGLVSEIEHLNVQSQQSQIQHDLEVAREDIALALLDLQKALHIDVNEPLDVSLLDGPYFAAMKKEMDAKAAQAETSEKEQTSALDGLTELAYEHRPEFIIQKSKVDAARSREKAAIAGWFPQVMMQGSFGQKAEAYIEDDNRPPWDVEHRFAMSGQWNIAGNTLRYMYDKNRQGTGVEATDPTASLGQDGYYDRKNTASISLLDDLEQFAKTKEAEISRKEAQLELELSEKDIVSEVKESYFNYNRALIQLRAVFKRLEYRRKLVDLARHRSDINEIQLSEYLQAELDLISERDQLYKAMTDFYVAKASLNKAVGVKDYSPIVLEGNTAAPVASAPAGAVTTK